MGLQERLRSGLSPHSFRLTPHAFSEALTLGSVALGWSTILFWLSLPLTLARRCGVDPGKVREAMLGGVAASRVLELFGKRTVERDFDNGIESRLYHKDLNIVLDLAHSLGIAAPAAAVVLQQLNALVGSGGGKSDFSRMIEVLEKASER